LEKTGRELSGPLSPRWVRRKRCALVGATGKMPHIIPLSSLNLGIQSLNIKKEAQTGPNGVNK
jgi:hypothetical protein